MYERKWERDEQREYKGEELKKLQKWVRDMRAMGCRDYRIELGILYKRAETGA